MVKFSQMILKKIVKNVQELIKLLLVIEVLILLFVLVENVTSVRQDCDAKEVLQ